MKKGLILIVAVIAVLVLGFIMKMAAGKPTSLDVG